MQSHEKTVTLLDLINEEIRDIFSLIDKVPYPIMLKIIGLNSVLMDEKNVQERDALRKLATEMDIPEDSLRASDILKRINKLNKMIFDAYVKAMGEEHKESIVKPGADPLAAKNKKIDALGSDEMFPMLVEFIKLSQGKNTSNLWA